MAYADMDWQTLNESLEEDADVTDEDRTPEPVEQAPETEEPIASIVNKANP